MGDRRGEVALWLNRASALGTRPGAIGVSRNRYCILPRNDVSDRGILGLKFRAGYPGRTSCSARVQVPLAPDPLSPKMTKGGRNRNKTGGRPDPPLPAGATPWA